MNHLNFNLFRVSKDMSEYFCNKCQTVKITGQITQIIDKTFIS